MAFNLRSPGLPVGQSPFSQKSSQTNPLYEKDSGKKNISFKEYRESGKMDPSEAKYYKGSGTKRVSSDFKAATAEDPGGAGETIEEASKPKITGKIGSDLRRQQYKDNNLKDDATTKKNKAKTVSTAKAKGAKDVVAKKPKDSRSADKPVEKKAPKLAAKRAPKKELSKMEARKTKKINKKLSQAAEARANGNEKKALRKERAAARKTRRIATLNARKAKRSAKK
tara:strand:+ start:33 stop:707 length:675 start_codon:yes stop_codon:yes gene_type:complete